MVRSDRWAYPIKCTNVVLADDKKTVLELHVEYDREKRTKPKVSGLSISMLSSLLLDPLIRQVLLLSCCASHNF